MHPTLRDREAAIQAGILIDVTPTALQLGITFPVTITRPLWEMGIVTNRLLPEEDQTSRLRDILMAFRLRLAAREYVVVERADKLRTIILDFFSLPILRAGQWLSSSISRINIFIFLFDFIIETPFKIFLNILEEWFGFLKEKKDELQ